MGACDHARPAEFGRPFRCVLGEGVVRMAAIAFEESAGFHREGFVQDVALDMAGGGQQNLAGTNAALHAAADAIEPG